MSPAQHGLTRQSTNDQYAQILVEDADGVGIHKTDQGADGDGDRRERIDAPVPVESCAGGGGAWRAEHVDCHWVAEEEGRCEEEPMEVPV